MMKMLQSKIRLILLLGAFTLMFPMSAIANEVFPDIEGHWAAYYITRLAERGYVSGGPDGMFRPDDPVTFPQFVTMIVHGEFGAQEPIGEHYASGYMIKARDKGLIFNEDLEKVDTVTRLEAVEVIYNTLTLVYGEEGVEDTSVVDQLVDYPT